MKKIAVIIISMAMICAMFTACGGSDSSSSDSTKSLSGDVNMGTSKEVSYNKSVLDKLPDEYKVSEENTEAELITKISAGEVDVAVLSPAGAAKLYSQSKNIEVISPVFVGGYRIMGNQDNIYLSGYSNGTQTTTTNNTDTTGQTGNTTTGTTDGTTQTTGTTSATEEEVTPANLIYTNISIYDPTGEYAPLTEAIATLGDTQDLLIKEQDSVSNLESASTAYNYVVLTNVCNSEISGTSIAKADEIMDVDAFWEEEVNEPLPAAVLVVSTDFINERDEDISVIISDYEAAFDEVEQPYKEGKLVFYGSSNRGEEILKAYYSKAFAGDDYKSMIPKAAFYYDK